MYLKSHLEPARAKTGRRKGNKRRDTGKRKGEGKKEEKWGCMEMIQRNQLG